MAADDVGQWKWWLAPPGAAGDTTISAAELKQISSFCSASHIGLATTLQVLLHLALPAPWSSWDGKHATRVAVTGILNPETLAGIYAYLLKFVDPTIANGFRSHMVPSRRWTSSDLALLVWLAYYTPTYEVSDQGAVTTNAPLVHEADFGDLSVTAKPYVDTDKMRVDPNTRLTEWQAWPKCMTSAEMIQWAAPGVVAAKTASTPAAIKDDGGTVLEGVHKLPPDQVLSSKKPSAQSSGSPVLLVGALALAAWFMLKKG